MTVKQHLKKEKNSGKQKGNFRKQKSNSGEKITIPGIKGHFLN